MNEIKASIVVIGFQEENQRIYPHLRDVISQLSARGDEVVYLADEDNGYGLYRIDRIIRDFHEPKKSIRLPGHVFYLLQWLYKYIVGQKKSLVRKFKGLRLKNDRMFILAVDHHASVLAEKHFPGRVIFWSCDILAGDHPRRISGGFLEKLITSKYARSIKVLIVQDEDRKRLVEEAVGAKFPHTIYLPVSLNDSEFCRQESKKRRPLISFSEVRIIQSGWIVEGRYSGDLIDSYQRWPDSYKLDLHGFMDRKTRKKISEVERRPGVCENIYDNDGLSQLLNQYDLGFVGYKEEDSNHRYIKNASGQLVEFLRLGIPVIACGSDIFNDFINRRNLGIGIFSMEEIVAAIEKIINNYAFFSYHARKAYETEFNLKSIFDNSFYPSLGRLFNEDII